MRKLPKPTDDAGAQMDVHDVFGLCISRMRSRELRERLGSVEDVVTAAAAAFDINAAKATLHEIPRVANIGGVVSKDEMVSVYTLGMVPKAKPGRSIYDKIMSAPPFNRCPLCDVGTVSTLDHHLPKAEYPDLVVTPNNLVPSCTWCQTEKLTDYPTTEGEQTIHPYFDDFDQESWLRAEVVQGAPASFLYKVDPPQTWILTRVQRVWTHFNSFKLSVLYASNAGSELTNIRHRLSELFAIGGIGAVQAHLTEEATTRKHAQLNSWRTAMYEAAANSNWFCNRGFELA